MCSKCEYRVVLLIYRKEGCYWGVVGHDHNNDYMVDLDGNITLAYGRKTGYPSAYNETLSRGVRVINLHENESVFDTYIRDLKGTYFHYQFEQKTRAVIFLVSVVPLCKSFW